MTRASNDLMAELHGKVAKVMIGTIDRFENAMQTDISQESEDFAVPELNPAFLSVCTKFLKDNSITVDMGENSDVQELKNKVKENNERRARRKVGNVTFLDQN